MKPILKFLLLTCLVCVIFFAPLVYAHGKYPPTNREDIIPADAALVFGALVRDDRITPLHAERLKAAIDLLERQLISTIVVSNSKHAASVMVMYLEDMGVSSTAIEIDSNADQTPDTCRNEVARNEPRTVILISQSFHIPRLSLQCEQEGVLGQSLAAEGYRASTANESARWRIVQIRLVRHAREAALIWAAILGLYD